MKVFLAGIMQGSKADDAIHSQDWRRGLCAALARRLPEAEIYCHYSTHPDSMHYDLPQIRQTFEEGLSRAMESDLLIAYCPSASMGTAIEMYEAYRRGAIILAVSPMSANWVLRCYSHAIVPDFASLEQLLDSPQMTDLLAGRARARGGRPTGEVH